MHRGGPYCFLLAALHLVAERVNPRKARPPAPHGPRVLASAAGPHLPRLGEESRASRGSARTRTLTLAIFSVPADMPRWLQVGTKLRIVAAEACGAVFGPTGTGPRRVVRLPTADSLCDRMERGEEEPVRAAAMHFGAANSADEQARRLPTSDRRKFPSGNFRSARDFEGAKRVSRGQAFRQPEMSPLARRPPRTPPPPQPQEVRPRLLGIEE